MYTKGHTAAARMQPRSPVIGGRFRFFVLAKIMGYEMTPEQQTFPESTTFKWEAGRYEYAEAAELMQYFAKQGGSDARRAAYRRAADLILERDHDDMTSTDITGDVMKTLLIQAAREVEWMADKRMTFTKPPPVPSGQKVCFVCKEAKPTHDFLTDPSPAQIAKYGWRPDTKKKVPTHVCSACRRKRNDAARYRKGKRAPQLRTLLQTAASVDQAHRMQDYARLLSQITKHRNRVGVAISQARKVLPAVDPVTGEESMINDYQFRNDTTKDFYFMKRDMLEQAQVRLEKLLGEDAPIPARWGMLLTKDEQQELAFLHDDAFNGMKKVHQLW